MGISLKDLGNKFNQSNNLEVSEGKFLGGDKIHEVVFKEIRREKMNTKNGELDSLVISFVEASNPENGRIFEDRTFEFNNESMERKQNQWGESPAPVENTIYKYRIFIDGVLPKVSEALLSGKKNIDMDSWDSFANQMVSLFTAGVKKFGNPVCKLKLVKNNAGFANLPFFLAVSRNTGECYVNNAFFGNVEKLTAAGKDIMFTEREMTAIKNRESNTSKTASTTDLLGGVSNDLNATQDLDQISEDDFSDIGL